MSKLDKMNLSQILEKIGLCLVSDSMRDIWKTDAKPEKNIFNPKGISAEQEFANNENLINELININNRGKLSKFLFGHEAEIDKVKLVLNILLNYKMGLEKRNLSSEQKMDYQEGLENAKSLLKDVNETYIYCITNPETSKIDSLAIINTKDEAEGRQRTKKERNTQRLKKLEEDEKFSNIVLPITPEMIQHILPYSKDIGKDLRLIVEYNTVLEEFNCNMNDFTKMCKEVGYYNYLSEIKQEKFLPEKIRVLRDYIEKIDIDKLFLCAASGYIDALEAGEIPEEDIPKVYKTLQSIQKHVKKTVSLDARDLVENPIKYDSKTLSKDLLRFVKNEEGLKYLTIDKCSKTKESIINGTLSLNSLNPAEFNALLFSTQEINSLLEVVPDNYIFFLRQGKLINSKEIMLENIINSNHCSQELLKLLCEKTDITPEEIHQLFDIGIISIGDLENIKELRQDLISDEKVFKKYVEYRDSGENKEEARVQLERYALAYRKIELLGKTDENIEQRGEKFVETLGDEIDSTDLIQLYGLDILPLKVAVDWGGEDIIGRLLQTEKLKPSDARNLRDKGLLDENVLERLFKNNKNMSYAYQVALVCTIFDGQTPQEQEIQQRLAQYYNIESGLINSGSKGTGQKRGRIINTPSELQPKVKMRDPGAKYNLLSAIDKGLKIEEGIVDGHIIFHYPNVDGGTVLIEKLHKITTNKETGLIEIRADNSAATYIFSEEEFIGIKPRLIQGGKIDRTQLTQKWYREPGHWIAHIGKDSWERGLKERFEINSQNPRYSSLEDLKKMEELLLNSAHSKDIEDR